eukprot:4970384-Lingulodinium_polyedra.AAC.1
MCSARLHSTRSASFHRLPFENMQMAGNSRARGLGSGSEGGHSARATRAATRTAHCLQSAGG